MGLRARKGGGEGGNLYDDPYREALPDSGAFFRVYERVGISLVTVGVYKRVGKSEFLRLKKSRKVVTFL